MDSQLLFLGVRTEQYMLYKDSRKGIYVSAGASFQSAIQRRPVR